MFSSPNTVMLCAVNLISFGAMIWQLPDEQPLRVGQLQRCDDLLQQDIQEFCLRVSGLDNTDFQVKLNGTPLQAEVLDHNEEQVRVRITSADAQSGPLWFEQASNPVWISLKGSHVVAATNQEVAKNMDGLTTYVDADDLTAPILPSERANELDHPDIGLSARLDMYKALDLTVQSLDRDR